MWSSPENPLSVSKRRVWFSRSRSHINVLSRTSALERRITSPLWMRGIGQAGQNVSWKSKPPIHSISALATRITYLHKPLNGAVVLARANSRLQVDHSLVALDLMDLMAWRQLDSVYSSKWPEVYGFLTTYLAQSFKWLSDFMSLATSKSNHNGLRGLLSDNLTL